MEAVPTQLRRDRLSDPINPRSTGLLVAGLMLALAVLAPPAMAAGTERDYTLQAQSYSGSRDRQYTVYAPDGLNGLAPMVMALHGCKQNHDDVLQDWGLKAAADRYGFLLVAPFITSYDGLRNKNCWGFWFDGHRHEGMGEPEDLHQIALEVESRFSVDPERRYITGLSSGGAMTVVASVTHNEYWAAAAAASGLAYGEDAASVSLSGQCPGFATFHAVSRVVQDMEQELDDSYRIPLMVLQNNRDCKVIQPAGRNIRGAQLRVFGDDAHDSPGEARAQETACSPANGDDYGCRHVYYTVDGTANTRSVAETIFYDGPQETPNRSDTNHGHYWIGGEHGNNGKWSIREGPSYPDIVWDFFDRHPRGASTPLVNPRSRSTGPARKWSSARASSTAVPPPPIGKTAACRSMPTAALWLRTRPGNTPACIRRWTATTTPQP